MAEINKINIKGVDYDIGGGSNDLVIVGDGNYEKHLFAPVFAFMVRLGDADKYDTLIQLYNFLNEEDNIDASFSKIITQGIELWNEDIDAYGEENGITDLWNKIKNGYYDNIIFRFKQNGAIVPNFELKFKNNGIWPNFPGFDMLPYFSYKIEIQNLPLSYNRINKIVVLLHNSDMANECLHFDWAVIATKAEEIVIDL